MAVGVRVAVPVGVTVPVAVAVPVAVLVGVVAGRSCLGWRRRGRGCGWSACPAVATKHELEVFDVDITVTLRGLQVVERVIEQGAEQGV